MFKLFKTSKAIVICILSVMGVFLLQRCAHSDIIGTIELEHTFFIADETGLIRTRPAKITCADDTTFRLLEVPDKILEYNSTTKQLTVLFDTISFNIDSLINKNYQIINKHKYKYYKHSGKDIKNYDHNLYVLSSFSYNNGNYYIPLSIKTMAEYISDEETPEKDKNELDSIKLLTHSSTVNSLETLSYFIVTDKDFKQKNIFPFYLKNKEGVISKLKGGYVYDGNYYVSMHSKQVVTPSDSLNIEGLEPDFYFKYFTLKDTGILASKLLISKDIIKSKEYTWARHLQQKVSYYVYEKQLLASMGREIINLTANKLWKKQPILETDELISNFSISDNYLIYTTEKYEKEMQGSGSKKYGYFNGLSSCKVKMMDMQSRKLVLNEPLTTEGIYFISPANYLYQYVEDKDSLRINKYSLHPHE